MAKIAVLGGTGYLTSLIKNQNICKKINIFLEKEYKNFFNYKFTKKFKDIQKI